MIQKLYITLFIYSYCLKEKFEKVFCRTNTSHADRLPRIRESEEKFFSFPGEKYLENRCFLVCTTDLDLRNREVMGIQGNVIPSTKNRNVI